MADMLGKVLVGVGVLLALVGGFVVFQYMGLLLLLLGLVYGFFSVKEKLHEFVVAGLGLALGAGFLGGFSTLSVGLGSTVNAIFGNVIVLFGSAVLAVSLRMFYGYMKSE